MKKLFLELKNYLLYYNHFELDLDDFLKKLNYFEYFSNELDEDERKIVVNELLKMTDYIKNYHEDNESKHSLHTYIVYLNISRNQTILII